MRTGGRTGRSGPGPSGDGGSAVSESVHADEGDRRRSRLPKLPGPSRWRFMEPVPADPEGFVGFGADLEPATLVHAYRQGVFPWPHPGAPLPWFCPDPRGVLVPADIQVSRSLRQRLRRSGWDTTVDRAFGAVIVACARARGRNRDDSWITSRM